MNALRPPFRTQHKTSLMSMQPVTDPQSIALRDGESVRRVLELERLRVVDLRDNQELHERLESEIQTSWALWEALVEHKTALPK